jgi:MAC/Perforin domain
MVMKQEQVLIRDGYDIGIGVASATGSPMALGTTGAVTPPQVGTGGSGSFSFRRIDSSEELETELGISADASAGVGLFSGSASFDFSKQCKIQSSSLAVLVSARETFAFQQMDSPELTPAAAALVDQGHTHQFPEQFGEYFVRGISSGGRFIGVVRIDTKSKQSKTEVDAALSGSYGLTVSADVKMKLSETLRSANARVEAFYTFDGGEVTTRLTSNDPVELVQQLYSAMDEWTASVRDRPKAYSVTLAPYAIALGPAPPNVLEFEHQRDVLIRCGKLRSQTLDKINLVDYILDPNHMGEFAIVPPPEGPDLAALQAALAGDLDVIADAAAFAINDIKRACEPEVFMRTIKGVNGFQLTPLPANLPEHTGGPVIAPAPAPPADMFTIPNWRTTGEVDDLGGTLNIVVLAQNDNAQPTGTIVSIVPAPGTVVPISSEITVTTIRNLLTDPIPGS